ncbi:MAG: DUF4276 family protein, partial [Pirellulaceae bacterium]|nr:DUF4276 family protein [Pirellulaceae bacterium]
AVEPRGVLVLIDADDDCPAELGPELLARAGRIRPDIPLGVVIAKSEFESWILAGIEGLRGKRGIPDDVRPLDDPESIRDAKGRLSRLMGTYKETVDQPALTSHFDLHQARRRSDSFDKLCREIHRLLEI